ncbi:restriction endonuclease subunit S [bacterium]|nr:restriction endonuclease subunit S [bacterium]
MIKTTGRLGDIAQIFSGITVSAQFLASSRRSGGGIVPVVGMTSLQSDESILIDGRVTADGYFVSRCLVWPGDVLISSRSTQIRARVVPEEAPVFAINSTLLAIRPNPDVLDPYLLAAYLRHPIGQANLLRNTGSSTAQLNITVRSLESLPIPLLPIEQQNKLAALFEAAETQKRLAIQAAESGYRIATELVFRDFLSMEKKFHG